MYIVYCIKLYLYVCIWLENVSDYLTTHSIHWVRKCGVIECCFEKQSSPPMHWIMITKTPPEMLSMHLFAIRKCGLSHPGAGSTICRQSIRQIVWISLFLFVCFHIVCVFSQNHHHSPDRHLITIWPSESIIVPTWAGGIHGTYHINIYVAHDTLAIRALYQ